MFGSSCACIPLNFDFSASFFLANENPVLTPVCLDMKTFSFLCGIWHLLVLVVFEVVSSRLLLRSPTSNANRAILLVAVEGTLIFSM